MWSGPPCRHATIGNVPCVAALRDAGAASSSSTTSSIPPVPNVILASPRRTQPCPTSDACWSPTSAVIGGAPGSAVRVADDAGGVDDRRHHRGAGRRARRARARPTPDASRFMQAGDRGVGRVGDVERAVRQRPRHPRVDGAEAQVVGASAVVELVEQPLHLGGRLVRADAHALAAEREARADRAQVLPAERGPDRLAGRRGPTRSVEPRWLEMPTASTGPAASSAARARSRHVRAMQRGVELDEAVGGRVGQQLALGARRRSCRRRRRPRRARCSCRRRRRGRARSRLIAAHGQATAPNGLGEAELAGVEDPVRVERVLHRLQHAEARAERLGDEARRGSARRRGGG